MMAIAILQIEMLSQLPLVSKPVTASIEASYR